MVRASVVDSDWCFRHHAVCNPRLFGLHCQETLKMRKSLWIILAIMVVAIAAPNAHADSTPPGTYTAECIGPCASDPKVTFSFVAIDFTVFGNTIDFTGLSLTTGHEFGWNIDNGSLSLTDLTTGNPIVAPVTLAFPASNEAGLFLPAMAPATTPEPSFIALMLLGVGLVFVMRKRMAQHLLQVS
jgi:PEP-CTERM motif